MHLALKIEDLIILGGLFIAIIMGIAVGLKARKHTANLLLIGFLISSAAVIIVKLLYSTGNIVYYPHWFKVNYPTGILRPVFIYLYVHYLINDLKKYFWQRRIRCCSFGCTNRQWFSNNRVWREFC